MSKSRLFGLFLLLNHVAVAQIDRSHVADFARNFAYENKIHIDNVMAILDKANYHQSIIDKMNRPAEKMPWYKYRKIFLNDKRINAGVAFWDQHEAILNHVKVRYEVDPMIIVGIIGVESYYGNRKGQYKVLDALYTLSFGYPRRSKFFKSELAEFLLLVKKEGLDVNSIKGSYAGAMGYGQFMPSSYQAYARSYDDDGNRDLMNSVPDAIASVANYLKAHQWQLREPIAQLATANADAKTLPKQSIKPRKYLSYYEELGYHSTAHINPHLLLSLQKFELEQGNEFWFVFNNFYVITRYNHSPLYALAVYQLAEAINNKRLME